MSGHAPASSACLGCLSSVGPALSPSLPLPLQSIRGAVFSRTGAKCPDLHKQMRGARSRNGECAPPSYSDQSQALRPPPCSTFILPAPCSRASRRSELLHVRLSPSELGLRSHLTSTLAGVKFSRRAASRSAESKQAWPPLSLNQHLAAILDVDALLHLLHTLTAEVIDGTIGAELVCACIHTADACAYDVLEHGIGAFLHGA